jgi:hypothetical protein
MDMGCEDGWIYACPALVLPSSCLMMPYSTCTPGQWGRFYPALLSHVLLFQSLFEFVGKDAVDGQRQGHAYCLTVSTDTLAHK